MIFRNKLQMNGLYYIIRYILELPLYNTHYVSCFNNTEDSQHLHRNIMNVDRETFLEYLINKDMKFYDKCPICSQRMIAPVKNEFDDDYYIGAEEILSEIDNKRLIKCAGSSKHIYHTLCFIGYYNNYNGECKCPVCNYDCSKYFKIYFNNILNGAYVNSLGNQNEREKMQLDEFLKNTSTDKLLLLLDGDSIDKLSLEYLHNLIKDDISLLQITKRLKEVIEIKHIKSMHTSALLNQILNHELTSKTQIDEFFYRIHNTNNIEDTGIHIKLNARKINTVYFLDNVYSMPEFVNTIIKRTQMMYSIEKILENMFIFIGRNIVELKSHEIVEMIKIAILHNSIQTIKYFIHEISGNLKNTCNQLNTNTWNRYLSLNINELIDLTKTSIFSNIYSLSDTLNNIWRSVDIKNYATDGILEFIDILCEININDRLEELNILCTGFKFIRIYNFGFLEVCQLVCMISKLRSADKINDNNIESVTFDYLYDMFKDIKKYSRVEIDQIFEITKKEKAFDVLVVLTCIVIKHGYTDIGVKTMRYLLTANNDALFINSILFLCTNHIIYEDTFNIYLEVFDQNKNIKDKKNMFITALFNFSRKSRNSGLLILLRQFLTTQQLNYLNEGEADIIIGSLISDMALKCNHGVFKKIMFKSVSTDTANFLLYISNNLTFFCKHFEILYKKIAETKINYNLTAQILNKFCGKFVISDSSQLNDKNRQLDIVLLDSNLTKKIFKNLLSTKRWKYMHLLLGIDNISKMIMIEALYVIVLRKCNQNTITVKEEYINIIHVFKSATNIYKTFMQFIDIQFLDYIMLNNNDVINAVISTDTFINDIKHLF